MVEVSKCYSEEKFSQCCSDASDFVSIVSGLTKQFRYSGPVSGDCSRQINFIHVNGVLIFRLKCGSRSELISQPFELVQEEPWKVN